MNYKKVISAVSKKTGFRIKDVTEVLDTLGEVVIETLKTDEEVKPIRGLTLYKKVMKERGGYNPYRDAQMIIPERYKLCSRFTETLADIIKGE